MTFIEQTNFKGRKAVIRVDFNVPLDSSYNVTDDTRIRAAKPTIMKVLEDGGSCILMSHLGRPVQNEDKFSLKHIVSKVEEIIGVNIIFSEDCIGDKTNKTAESLLPGQVMLLENLRFYKEETQGDYGFAKALGSLGDFYINDAFGTAHRAHASTTVIAEFFPNNKCFGYLLAKEIESLDKQLKDLQEQISSNNNLLETYNKVITNKSEELESYKEASTNTKQKGLFTSLIGIIDFIEKFNLDNNNLDEKTKNYLIAIQDKLEIALSSTGIEKFEPNLNDNIMEVMGCTPSRKTQKTNNKNKVNLISRVLKPGYRILIKDDKFNYIKNAEVEIFELEQK